MHRLRLGVGCKLSSRSATITAQKCRCFSTTPCNENAKEPSPRPPTYISRTLSAVVSHLNKSSIMALLSKLGLYQETIESYIPDPDLRRSHDPDVDKYLKLCEATMKIANKAILSTINSPTQDGHSSSPLKSRALAPFPAPPGLPHIYFMTNKLSRKVVHMQHNSNVVLTYLDAEGIGYVTFEGRAEILSDEESTSHWTPMFTIHIPEGPVSEAVPDSRFLVVRLVPSRVEFSSVRFGFETAHDSWLPPAMIRDGDGEWKLDPTLSIR